MTIQEWYEGINKPSITSIQHQMKEMFGAAPTRQALENIIKGKTPSLEIAIMINELSAGAVDFDDMVVNGKYINRREEEPEETEEYEDDENNIDNLFDSL